MVFDILAGPHAVHVCWLLVDRCSYDDEDSGDEDVLAAYSTPDQQRKLVTLIPVCLSSLSLPVCLPDSLSPSLSLSCTHTLPLSLTARSEEANGVLFVNSCHKGQADLQWCHPCYHDNHQRYH